MSHALAVALNEDRPLLRSFLKFAGVGGLRRRAQLGVIEQSLPGGVAEELEEESRSGLPDVVVYDNTGWCLAVESKVEAGLTQDQLERHERTLRRRGMTAVELLSITAKIAGGTSVRGFPGRHMHWTDVYRWLGQQRRPWAERLREYMRVLESRLAREGYLKSSTLTEFDGFHFDEEHPYNALEGRRLLKLIMKAMRKRSDLKLLGAKVNEAGRPVITGSGETSVWDAIPMGRVKKGKPFNTMPHLTLSLTDAEVVVAITIPHATGAATRKGLVDLGVAEFQEIHRKILTSVRRLNVASVVGNAYALQRHFKSRRSGGTDDARVSFDLAATLPGWHGKVKHQPEWLDLFMQLLKNKRSNLQFGYEIRLPYSDAKLRGVGALDVIAKAWGALRPVLACLDG